MTKPNTFLIGAPKCGTTSIASWLKEHEDVFFSKPKEPHFFVRSSLQMAHIHSLKDYEALFFHANEQKIIAEGTTAGMYDETSIPKIFRYNPEASIIVMLRNPLEQAISWYQENVKQGRESIEDFYEAWCKSGTRKQDLNKRPDNLDPLLLNYKAVSSLGSQLQHVYKYFDKNKVHIIIFDDLVAEPRKVWKNLLMFLKITDENRKIFEAKNIGFIPKKIKSYYQLRIFFNYIKKLFGFKGGSNLLNYFIYKRFKKQEDKPIKTLSSKQKDIILDFYLPEINLLEKLLDKELSHWKR